MTTGKAFLSVLAGLAAGTVIGMLIAPKKRSRSNRDISKKTQALADALNETMDEKFSELLKSISGEVKKKQEKEES
jgi:gas vesicle protein